MPKVGTTTFSHKNAAGESLEFKSEISVDADGIFSVTVPEDVAKASRSLIGLRDEVWVTQPRQNHRLTGRNLDQVKRAVKSAMKELMTVETITERVIVYSHITDLSAWQDNDGALHANGYIGERREDGGRWHPMGTGINATHPVEHFRVGLYAKVLDQVTYRRPNSVSVEFKRPEWGHHHLDHPTWGSKLNGFSTLHGPRDLKKLPRLPYTEENAKFFYEMLIGLCHLGRRMHDFFGDQGNVTAAIERGAVPLLGHAEGHES